MAEVRACVQFLVILFCFHGTVAKPFFGSVWCNAMCDDSSSSDDDYDDILCWACPSKPKPAATVTEAATAVTPALNQSAQGPINLVIPPSSGVNVTLSNTGGSWLMNFIPWASGSMGASPPAAAAPAAPSEPAATTAAVPTTTAAGATTAAATTPAATTAAPAA